MSRHVQFKNIVCSNCETAKSTHRCLHCDEEQRYFCFECSILHTKIKAFKAHTINPLPIEDMAVRNPTFDFDNMKNTMIGIFLRHMNIIISYLEHVYDVANDRGIDSFTYYTTIGACIGGSVIAFYTCRWFLGDKTLLVLFCVLYAYHFLERRNSDINKQINGRAEKIKSDAFSALRQQQQQQPKPFTAESPNTDPSIFGSFRDTNDSRHSTRPTTLCDNIPINKNRVRKSTNWNNHQISSNRGSSDNNSVNYHNRQPSIFDAQSFSDPSLGNQYTNNKQAGDADAGREFRGEFWHDQNACKPAKFRPRTRVYKPRIKQSVLTVEKKTSAATVGDVSGEIVRLNAANSADCDSFDSMDEEFVKENKSLTKKKGRKSRVSNNHEVEEHFSTIEAYLASKK